MNSPVSAAGSSGTMRKTFEQTPNANTIAGQSFDSKDTAFGSFFRRLDGVKTWTHFTSVCVCVWHPLKASVVYLAQLKAKRHFRYFLS